MNIPCQSTALLATSVLLLWTSPSHAETQQLAEEAFTRQQWETTYQLVIPSVHEGEPWALTLLAHLYRDGLGVHQDEYRAFELYMAAARQGELEAIFQVGTMYLAGSGVEENEEKAIEWLEQAQARKHPYADSLLSSIYNDDFSLGC